MAATITSVKFLLPRCIASGWVSSISPSTWALCTSISRAVFWRVPEGHYAAENMKSTVVPFRNGIMLSIAVGIAESNGLKKVLIANHGGDHTIYPDCRPEFIDAIDKAAQAGTFVDVQVSAPYTNITKADIARIGKRLGIDYAETWSCYKGGETHCGKCGTCVERKEALAEAGIEDHTKYLE